MAEHHPPLAADEAQTLADRVAERMFALDRASQAMGMRIDEPHFGQHAKVVFDIKV